MVPDDRETIRKCVKSSQKYKESSNRAGLDYVLDDGPTTVFGPKRDPDSRIAENRYWRAGAR